MSVLIKAALIAVLLYFMFKAAANMMRAVLEDPHTPHNERVENATGAPSARSSRATTRQTRAFGEVEVEDAKWEDL